ncbi:KANADI like transcription factor, putative isoform 1 [Hibiscus syriacus]|uniref:KANADI like transcription factor, putative isoform 1 n=1 Tax=Hibiscus syriacus TaxID=106335 RepID=A0A6A2Z0S4_HIBSY|nr:KANADI like transcription factor, putative isoform 1 [Hibiscus syriacus]
MAEQMKGAAVGENNCTRSEETLQDALHRLISSIIYPEASAPLLQRIKISVSENVPRLGEASRNTSRSVLQWTRRGSPLRALIVISVRGFPFLFSNYFVKQFLDALLL